MDCAAGGIIQDIAAWAEAVREWMKSRGNDPVSFIELRDSTDLPLVKLWMGLLLGGFELVQGARFYECGVIAMR